MTLRRTWLIGSISAVALAGWSVSGCSPSLSDGFGGSGGSGQTAGHGSQSGTGSEATGQSPQSSAAQFMTGGSTGAGMTCTSGPNDDMDGDGWTPAQGDCNDCDKNVNPGAIEVIPDPLPMNYVPADEDCDGTADNPPPTCDSNIGLTDTDPMHAAQVIELCHTATATDKNYGVISAKYVRANGTTYNSPGAQVGIQPNFGPNVHVRGGVNMLMLSSGDARTPGQPGNCGTLSCSHNLNGTPPPNFPQDNPNCPPSADINDDVGLELNLRAPTNATGYSFAFKFYSFEFPEWVCNDFNDQFIALVNPAPMGSINGNISFDNNHNAVSVNLGFFDVCDPSGASSYALYCSTPNNCPSPPSPYCPSGPAELSGTGFDVWDSAGGTVWLQSQAPVTGGSTFTIRYAIWDTGDQAWDSSVLVDNFQWIANGGTVSVGTTPVPM